MSTSDFHERRFDEETQCKLDIYRQYLRSWLPVFLHREHIRSIQIFDFFAGPGHDGAGNAGSPVIASEEDRVVTLQECHRTSRQKARVAVSQRTGRKTICRPHQRDHATDTEAKRRPGDYPEKGTL